MGRERGKEGWPAYPPVDEEELEGEDHAGPSEAPGDILEGSVR